jgi:hypothetical protein
VSISIPINSFDRGKPFYPLITNYLVLLIGFKDLVARGAIKAIEKDSGLNATINHSEFTSNLMNFFSSETVAKEFKQILTEFKGPLELKSEFQDNYIKVELGDIANELLYNGPYLLGFIMHSAGSLLILAHELSKDKTWHDKGPLWEFLRHCRNAMAHGGRFYFRRGEPIHAAEWGHLRIERALQGTPLFKDKKGYGLLSPGDPIRLLWDIEQAYPTMHA